MQPVKCPDGIFVEKNDAQIRAELSRRGLLEKFQHGMAIASYCVMAVPDNGSTDFFIALYGNPRDSGLLWYRFAGMDTDHHLVQGMANSLIANAGPVVIVKYEPLNNKNNSRRNPEGGGREK
jgi:hypothetical protein